MTAKSVGRTFDHDQEGTVSTSLLGQETAHGYGLDPSRRNGSTDGDHDPWDTLSPLDAHHLHGHLAVQVGQYRRASR